MQQHIKLYFRGEPRQKVFPIQQISGGTLEQLNQPIHSTNRLYNPEGIARSIRSQAGGKGAKTGLYKIKPVLIPTNTKLGYDIAEELNDGIRLQYENSETARGRVVKGYSQALQAGGQIGVLDNSQIRRLTPIEYERLQAFPDNWTEDVSDTQRYKQLGNAVTTNVIQAIFTKLLRTTQPHPSTA